MTVNEMNEGEKIPYEVNGTNICFNDDLTINLAKRQKDEATRIYVCSDKSGALVMGDATGLYYVASILIPAKKYTETTTETTDEETGETTTETVSEAQDLDMDEVEIDLFALENYEV